MPSRNNKKWYDVNMKKVVISGSNKKPEEIKKWIEYWNGRKGFSVIKSPKNISPEYFEREFSDELKDHLQMIADTDILFVANCEKDGMDGYIGSGVYAEIVFAVSQNILYGKNIKIILAEKPATDAPVFDEISALVYAGAVEIFKYPA